MMNSNAAPASNLFATQPFDRINRPSPLTGFSPTSDPTNPLTVAADVFSSAASSVAIVPQSIVFIDTQIADYQQLAAGVDPNAQVVLLNANEDGITQISNFLATQTGISAIHIVSHGSSGSLQLGNSYLNHQTLGIYESSLRAWANALTEDADILLYGCEVAAGDLGQAFVDIFSQWTGADIAASTNLTGQTAAGGDWIFEVNTGEIAANLLFQTPVLTAYSGVFADISGGQQAAITSGLNSFATWAGALGNYGQFSQPLVLINQPTTAIDTVGEAVNLEQVIRNQLGQTVTDYFATDPDDPNTAAVETFTTQGLASFINTRFSAWSVVADDTDPTTLQLNINILNPSAAIASPIDLGQQASNLGLSLPGATGSFTSTLDLDFVLRIGAGNQFSVQVNNLTAIGQVDANLTGRTGTLGVLGITAGTGSSLSLTAGIQAIVNGGAALTSAQLDPTNLASQVVLNAIGTGVNGTININPQPITGLTITGTPAISVSATAAESFISNPLNNLLPNLTPNADFGQIADFGNLSASDLQGMLQQLGTWFNQLGNSTLLNQTLPLSGSTTVGQAINFSEVFNANVLRYLTEYDGLNVLTPSPGSTLDVAANGRLGKTAIFSLLINDQIYQIVVQPDLPIPGNPGNNSMNDLIADINQAINLAVTGNVNTSANVTAVYDAARRQIVFQAAPGTTVRLHVADLTQIADPNLKNLVGSGLNYGSQTVLFRSAQELAALINARLAAIGATVQLTYTEAAGRKDLTFDLSPVADSWVTRTITPINFADLQGLTNIRNTIVLTDPQDPTSQRLNGWLNLNASALMDFTFGVNLIPNSNLEVAPPLNAPNPSLTTTNFQLAAPATFSLQIFEGTSTTAIGTLNTPLVVTIPASIYGSQTNLVRAVQVAIRNALLARPDLINAGIKAGSINPVTGEIEGSDVVAEWTGDRIAVSVRPKQNNGVAPTDRRLEITAAYTDPAYNQLGLLTAPTPYNGQLTGTATLQFFVNGSSSPTVVAINPDPTNTSIDALMADINTALDAAGLTTIRAARAIANSTGNRLVFRAIDSSVTRLEVLAAALNSDSSENTAITQLGFRADQRIQARGRATEFFLDNASFSGNSTLNLTRFDANQPYASANYGFLDLDISGSGNITATTSLTLKDPTTGGSRVTLQTLINRLVKNGAGQDNAVDIVTNATPTSGTVNLNLLATPKAGINGVAASPLTLNLPNWVGVARPYAVNGLSGYDPFKNIDFNRSIAGLKTTVSDYINQLATLTGVLNQRLPLLNQSVLDLLDLGDRLTSFVNQLEVTPVKSVQALNTLLQQTLGLPSNATLFTLDTVTGTPALRLDLPFQQMFSTAYGLDLDLLKLAQLDGSPLGSLTNLIGVSSTGNLNLGMNALLNLALGMDLTQPLGTPPTADTFFLYVGSGGTELTINAGAAASDLDFTAQIGPLAIGIVDGTAALLGNFTIATNGSGRRTLIDALASTTASVTGSASANLPLGGTANQIAVTINDLADFLTGTVGSVDLTLPDNLASLIASASPLAMLSDREVLIDGLDQLFLTLQDALDGEIYGIELPLIGSKLKEAGQFIASFRSEVLTRLSSLLRAYHGAPEGLVALIQQELTNAFTTLGFLGSPIVVEQDADQIEFRLNLQGSIPKTFAFEAGLSGLGLSLDASAGVNLNLGWNLNLAFGVDKTKGFYLDTATNNELSVQIRADLVGGGGAARARVGGVLGFLGLIAEEETDNSTFFALNFNVDLRDPNQDGFLTYSEMVASSTSLSQLVFAQATGDAQINLRLSLGADFDGDILSPKTDIEKAIPNIYTNLLVDWQPKISSTGKIEFEVPSFQFTDIYLDLGSFVSDFAGPFLSKIGKILEPLDWFLDPQDGLLYKRIPVISDLAGETINLKKLLELASDLNPGSTYAEIETFLDAIAEVYSLIDTLVEAADAGGRISLNGLLSSTNLLNSQGQSLDLRTQSLSSAFSLPSLSADRQATGASATFLNRLESNDDGGVEFGILKPENIIRLILGQTADLVEYRLPHFGFNFEYTQSFPIFGPLFADLRGFFGAGIDLGIGYDTRGFEFFRDTRNFGDLLAGFYLADLKDGIDIPELTLNGGIGAGASLNVAVARAGVEGGIEFIADFNLNDPDRDGKVRFSEMSANMSLNGDNPFAIFDISARLEWYFRAFIEILFVIDASMDLGRGVLAEFPINFNRPPILADKRGETLYLNVGRFAHNRINGNITDGDETIYAKQDGNSVLVWGFGISESNAQRYTGITKIVAYGDEGNDTIDLSGITSITTEISGGSGNDVLIGGGGSDKIDGGIGNDNINGNGGNDFLYGREGNDTIQSGAGNDLLDGGIGNDQLSGGDHNDILIGGAGNDVLNGGAGDDQYLFGNNWGIDTVTDASGNDTWDFANQANRVITTTDLYFRLRYNAIDVISPIPPGTAEELENLPVNLGSLSPVNWVHINGFGIENLKGGRGGDVFDIYQTGDTRIFLDGQGGSDEYRSHFADPSINPIPSLNVALRDTGNPWDTDVAIAFGSNNNDDIVVTDQLVRADFPPDRPAGTPPTKSQVFEYNYGSDSGIEALEVYARRGEDKVTVESSPVNISVLVSGNEDSDTIIVGGPTLNNIKGNQNLTGPLIVKGDGGKDRLIVNDSGDASDNVGATAGSLTDQKVHGLGMQIDIQYETIERVDIQLGSGSDQFDILGTIGGTTTVNAGAGNDTVNIWAISGIVAVNGNAGNDLLHVTDTDNSPNTAVTLPLILGGGSGNDTILGGGGNDQIRGDSDFTVAFTTDEAIVNEVVTYVTQSSQGQDSIQGRGGQDVIFGEGGDDNIIGGSAIASEADGADFIFGGAGNDVIAGDNATIDPITRLITNLDTPGNPSDSLFGDNGTLTFDSAGTPITINSNDTNGTLTLVAGTVIQATSHSAAGDGNDTIAGHVGNDNILGGGGNDSLAGNSGDDRILGDHGTVTYNASGAVTQITTTEPDIGGNDTVTGNDGDDLILGGAGNDSLSGGTGNDRILGDNGNLNYVVDSDPSTLDLVETSHPAIGGNDTITGNEGDDIVLGGAGNDSITGGAGNDQLLGDNGRLTLITGQLAQIETSDPSIGGNDSIAGDAGNDIILGGAGNDTLLGNADDDIILGDNGLVNYAADGNLATLDVIRTTNPADGGNDAIDGGTGNDTVFGGAAADTIDGQSGNDILFGDNGELIYVNGVINRIASTDVEIGGNDTIVGSDGNDTAIGGAANDSITGNLGDDVAIGDNGQLQFINGVLQRIETTAPATGGNDTIVGNEGNDRILGGSGNDSINGNADDDILLGDNGFLDYGEDSNLTTLDLITTTDPTFGGNDTIAGEAGNDTIIGGAANDSITGGAGNDVALGDHGRIRLTGGVVRLIETTDPSIGGNDTMQGDAGDDILLGGSAHDRISGDAGDDILLGDNGQLNYDVDGNLATLDLIISTDPAIGGNDTISGGDGRDIAFGGAGNDTITGGAGEDKLLGDNGQVLLTNGQPRLIQTIAPGIGGNDDISGNAEDDLIAGGFGDDILNGDDGDDRILGDNGKFDYTYAGDSLVAADNNPFTLDFFTTTDPTLGGNDLIVAGLGNDTVLGGTGSDLIYGDQGVDPMDSSWQVVATDDFNQDGFSDLLWRNSVTGRNMMWLMQGDRLLAARPLQDVTDVNWQVGGTGDFNGDGKVDMLWRHYQTGATGVWLMNGLSLVQAVGIDGVAPVTDVRWQIVGTGDFNGDGKVDMLWRHNQTGATGVWLMNGTKFVQAVGFTGVAPITDVNWRIAGVKDFNADGKVDLLWRHQRSGVNGIWLMDGTNFLTAQGILSVADLSWKIGGVGDVNGDGRPDIVWRNDRTGTVGLWHMNGNTLLGTAALPPTVSAAHQVTNTNWTIAGRADFNHDGQMDLLWRNSVTGQIAFWLMSGTTLKQEVSLLNQLGLPLSLGGVWDLVGTGDFNGDGEADLVWRNSQSGENAIWFMNGTTHLSATLLTLAQADPGWKIVGIADMNQDNQPDLIWRHEQSGKNGIWLMNGRSVSGFLGLDAVTNTAWKIVGVADVNGDQRPDLVWRNQQTGVNGVWMMNGNQMVSAVGLLPVTDPNWKLEEVGDFNGDGKVDLIWRNYATGLTGAWLMDRTQLLKSVAVQDGNSNNDVLLGDHGKVYSALPLWQNVFSIDTGANQGGAGDTIFGNQGDDLIMGQQGNDFLYGETGEDDMLGGHNIAGGADGSDVMDGGADADVMLGDNGVILRRPLGYQLWQRYPAPFADVIRDVTRYDDRDRIGGNDTMFGGAGDDVMHGQRGDDWMYGNAGDDEMYGELGNDNMNGGAGADTMLGDVGIITRAYNPDGTPRINQNGSWHRDVILTDVGSITASVNAATPSVEMFQTADLLLATGATNPDGSQRTDLQLITLFADGNDVMLGDDGDDAMFGQRGNDMMWGGSGNDYMQGNAGDDQIKGDAGDDLLIGDDSNNLAAFNTEIPNVTRGLHLIERSPGVNINLGLDGVVVMPSVNLVPKMTYGLLPTLTLAPQPFRDSSPIPVIGDLQASDGSVLRPLMSIVPNLANHLDLLSGQDTINGGAGRDLLVGDDFSNVMPLRTGNPGIDGLLDHLTRQLYQLIYDVHDLELATVNAPPQKLEIGNDDLDGDDDNDSVFGDNYLFFGPFVQQMPNSTSELGSLLVGLQSAIATISYGVNQLIPASSLSPKSLTLSIGNDVIRGGNGDDFLYADDSMTIAPILNTLNYQRGSFWSYNLAGANRAGRTNFRDYDLELGNDNVGGGDGHDVMVGGYSTLIQPLITVAAASSDLNLQRSLDLLINDIKTFIRDLHLDNHGILYSDRNQSHSLITQNDNMWGEGGNDLMVGDNITLTLPWLNGQINTSIPLSQDYLDYSEEQHNFMHALPHQYNFTYRRANFGFTRMAEDFMSGGDGNDILFGLRAIDILVGDLGADLLVGGDDADTINDSGAENRIRNTNPSPADRRDIINPTAQLMLSNALSPAMQQYIQHILQAQNNLALQGQFYANFPG
ncbi:DUF4347 domain-containing protein [Pantanalinema rosaneae CENA516]|uniref:DUF4347 domain-containing protein n=1 Tax=Pantanalinema rosaneae TaxID=1620701 RepID=UPI003D6DAD7A